jgi:hypothetical protein
MAGILLRPDVLLLDLRPALRHNDPISRRAVGEYHPVEADLVLLRSGLFSPSAETRNNPWHVRR